MPRVRKWKVPRTMTSVRSISEAFFWSVRRGEETWLTRVVGKRNEASYNPMRRFLRFIVRS